MTRILVAVSALSLGGAGCMAGHAATMAQPTAASRAPGGMSGMGGMAQMCPMNVPGTRVSAADVAGGEALTFTTTPENAAALQEKVHAMAEMHNGHHAGGQDGMQHGAMGHGGMGAMGGGMGGMGGGMDHGAGMQMPPPSRASVEDLPDGARITVTPNDAADLQRLQSTVRSHAEYMQQHGCEMMGHEG